MKRCLSRNRHGVANAIPSFAATLFMTLLSLSSTLKAQDWEIRNDRILAPEVTHFTRPLEPGVDAHGDLSLAIPLVTVPGRDGLDFDLVAQYRSGIQVSQSASWIGLGWSLDLGSISRHPLGGINYIQYNETQVDFTSEKQLPSQPDVMVVHMNGSSVKLMTFMPSKVQFGFHYDPHKLQGNPSAPEAGQCDAGQVYLGDTFTPAPWKPWKFCCEKQKPMAVKGYETEIVGIEGPDADITPQKERQDYAKFVMTTENGTRYVYGQPTLSQAIFPDSVGGLTTYRFVSAWHLVAILSPNYQGNAVPTEGSTGGWIKIEYRTYDQNNNTTDVHTALDLNDKFYAQITYPYKVESPTHAAIFETSRRYDRNLAIDHISFLPQYNFNQKLDKIKLFKKNAGEALTQISEVLFTYKNNVAANSSSPDNIMLSKLALEEIKIAGVSEN